MTKTTTGMWNRLVAGGAAILAAAVTMPANAGILFVQDIDARTMPWLWESDGLNSGYAFGIQDGLPPIIFNFLSFGVNPGDPFGVLYVGGLTTAFGGVPVVNNAGYVGLPFKNDVLGSSGTPFPSFYMSSDWGDPGEPDEGVFLNALVGAFTFSDGEVLYPFSLGTMSLGGSARLIGFSTSYVPSFHGDQMQFGLNDDIFFDNAGFLTICIDTNDGSCFRRFYGGGGGGGVIPEPATWAMLIAGFGLVGGTLRRSRAARLA